MVSAYLFDERQSERVEDWAAAFHGLSKNQLLWIDMVDASKDETVEVLDALDLGSAAELKLGDPEALTMRRGVREAPAGDGRRCLGRRARPCSGEDRRGNVLVPTGS